MNSFQYRGPVPCSKSLLNRSLIARSFFEDLDVRGSSQCTDVVHLKQALSDFKSRKSQSFECGEGGTTLRFLLARLSREQGEFRLLGSERLMKRPHQGLIEALESLGAQISWQQDRSLLLRAQGWNLDQELEMDLQHSSQFISAILLSAWDLDQPLIIKLGESELSWSYLAMTVRLLQKLGMEISVSKDKIVVPAEQQLKVNSVEVEPDMSSCFTLACFAAFNGELVIENFPSNSLQPDFAFVSMLDELDVPMHFNGQPSELIIHRAEHPKAADFDLKNNPDLFPVLAVYLSRVVGLSTLRGLQSLAHKESDRLANTLNLLKSLGFQCSAEGDRFQIQGRSVHAYPPTLEFDPDQDHRMAMAAALAQHQGASIDILTPEVVGKSFPEFWEILV